MATVLIRNGAVCGAYGAILAGRSQHSTVPTDYATIANQADAFASEFITKNAALVAPMADADNAEIGQLCQAAAYGALVGRTIRSTTATDYAAEAAIAVAAAKEAVAKLS